jgi:4-amino-4-deoxy-L-arabinose transferase-like glycosyltransferase
MAAVNDSARGAALHPAMSRIAGSIAASRLRSALAIVVVALVCFLPGFDRTPPLDRDETLAALTAQRMISTGDLARANLTVENRSIAPVGVGWLTAATVWLTGHADDPARPIWVYRVISIAAAVAAALLTWWTALALTSPRAALIAGLMFPAAMTAAAMARLAGPDAILTALVLLGAGALARLVMPRENPDGLLMPFLFWTAIGTATVIGGWVAAILFGSLMIALALVDGTAWIKRLALLPGLIWLAILLVPAALAMWGAPDAVGEGGPSFPAVQAQTDLNAPPGTYLLTFLVLFWPGAAFVVLAVSHVLDNARQRGIIFLLAWSVPYWLLIELWPGKLPQYALPIWPALAIMAAMAIDAGTLRTRGIFAWLAKLMVVLTPVGVGIYVAIGYNEDQGFVPAAIPVVFGLATLVSLLVMHWLDRPTTALAAVAPALIALAVLAFGVFAIVAPGMNRLKVAEKAVEEARRALRCPDPQIAVVGFREPSILLAGGDAMRVLSPLQAIDFLANGKCRVVLLDRRRQASFAQRAADVGLATQVRGTAKGYNVGMLRRVTIHAIVAEGAAE